MLYKRPIATSVWSKSKLIDLLATILFKEAAVINNLY